MYVWTAAKAYLCAGGVLEIFVAHPVDLPSEVIPCVDHFVG